MVPLPSPIMAHHSDYTRHLTVRERAERDARNEKETNYSKIPPSKGSQNMPETEMRKRKSPAATLELQRRKSLNTTPDAILFRGLAGCLALLARRHLGLLGLTLEDVGVVTGSDNGGLVLPAVLNGFDPLVVPDFFQRGPLPRLELQHAADDVSGFTRQYPKQAVRSFGCLRSGALNIFRRRISGSSLDLGSGRGGHWVGRGCEQAERVIGLAGSLPWEAAQCRAAEYDGEGPDVGWLWVILELVTHLGRKIWVGSDDAYRATSVAAEHSRRGKTHRVPQRYRSRTDIGRHLHYQSR